MRTFGLFKTLFFCHFTDGREFGGSLTTVARLEQNHIDQMKMSKGMKMSFAALAVLGPGMSFSLACGGGYMGMGHFDWVNYVEPANESMELYVEALMAEEAAEVEETTPDRRLTTKEEDGAVLQEVSIKVGRSDQGEPTVVLDWPAETGKTYTIQRSMGLDSWSVVKEGHKHTGPGKRSSFEDVPPKSGASFYRVIAR